VSFSSDGPAATASLDARRSSAALKNLRIFISSPSDVAEERLIARRVIGRLGAQFGDAVHFEPVFWEHKPLVATASFQEQLLRPSESDIVVVVLWSRFGTPLPGHIRRTDGTAYGSGTEFEFEDAVEGFRRNGKPGILVYRKTALAALPADTDLLEDHLRQKQALDRFVAKWFRNDADGTFKAAFHNFASPADFEDLVEAHIAGLAEAHLPAGTNVSGLAPTWREGSPFRGLAAFEPEHAAVFFGRTAAVATVLMKLRLQAEFRRAFVLVVSMSGGGKSSLVRAGVLPLLTQPGVVGHATRWRYAVMRPSDGQGDLKLALARALVQPGALPQTGACDPDWIEQTVAATGRSFAERVCKGLDDVARSDAEDPADAATECHLALVVDQLEEIFSDERIGAGDREAFVDTIAALARSGKVWVVATLRSDVYPRLAELPALIELKEGDGQFDLLPPTVREIGQIIRLPAAASGLRFEVRTSTAERLDDAIRDAAAKNPGALPLLQFLLEELYKRRRSDDVLTFRAYEELGGVEGALVQRAEAVLAGVGPGARRALPAVLRELVTFAHDDDSKALRRIAPRTAFDNAEAGELVDALVDARLLVTALDEQGHAAISLAHEALLEFWPRLRAWREQDRELLLVHARLSAATRAWEREDRSGDFLLARGKPLGEAKTLVAAGMRLSPIESALIAASERRGRQFALLRGGAIAGLVVLTGVAGVAAYRANVESGRARVQATTAQRTTDFMVSLFSIANPEENQGEKVTVREILDKGVSQISNELEGEEGVRGNLLRAMGQAYNGLGLYPKANDVLTAALVQAERSGIAADVVKSTLALADNRYQDGDYSAAESLYKGALEAATTLYGPNHAVVAQALTGLGESMSERDASGEAESLLRKALAVNIKLHGERHADTARTLETLGRVMYFLGRYQEAEPLFERALGIQQTLSGPRSANVALDLNSLGSLYFQVGRYDAAVDAWSKALPIYRDVFGPQHRNVANVLNNVGRVELLTGRLEAAATHLSEALSIDRKVLAPGHDDFILPLNSMAMVMLAEGNQEKARPLVEEALEIARSRRHWMLGQVLGTQAELDVTSRRMQDARLSLDQARTALQSQYGVKLNDSEAWRLAVLDCTEGYYELQRQNPDRAEQLLLTALPILETRFGKRSFYTDRALARLVDVYTATGHGDRASLYRKRLAQS